jgi:3-hydroxyisobutyrate dehydrogenase
MGRQIGFIGVGTMGRPMAINLIRAGHAVTVHDIVPAAAEALAGHGARVAATAREAAAAGEVVITMLPASRHVLAAMAGPDGVLAGLRPGATLLEMSTIDPGTSQRVAGMVAERGARMLDAPVSGGDKGAMAATLAIMVGGEADVLDGVRDILGALGTNIFHCGPIGMGETVKLCNNLITGVTMAAIAESFTLGMKAGVDPQVLYDVITRSSGNTWTLQYRVPVAGLVEGSPANDDFAPGFMTDLMHKDLGLALSAGEELRVPLAMTAIARQLYTMTQARGYGRKDFSAVMKLLEGIVGEEGDEASHQRGSRQ